MRRRGAVAPLASAEPGPRVAITRRVLLAAAISPHRATAQSDWLTPLMARMAAIPERHATFEETRTLAALSRPLLSHGLLLYRRPAHLEKTTIAPRPETLVVDGDSLTISGPDQNRHTLSLASEPPVAALVDAIRGPLSGDLAALSHSFVIAATGRAGGWRLTLTPFAPQLAQLVRAIVIDGVDVDIRTIVTTLGDGDTQAMAITDQGHA